MKDRVLYVIACAAPPSGDISKFIRSAQRNEWDTCLIVTPSAVKFIDAQSLEELTGHPVRSDYKRPEDPDALPEPDAIIVAPTTVNTINKWAAGICDTLALGLLVEAIGKGIPTVSLPFTNRAQAAHPAFEQNIAKLRSWGVQVLYGKDVYPLHEPGTGGQHLDAFPWHLALEAVADVRVASTSTDLNEQNPED
jgi:phosphopantothenoylcysteine synthetase/decarboxylase